MAFGLPPMPSDLMALLRRPVTPPTGAVQPGAPAVGPQPSPTIFMGKGGTNQGSIGFPAPPAPGVSASTGIPSAPAPTSARLPQVSDDPAVTGASNPNASAGPLNLPALPNAPDLSNAPTNDVYKMYMDSMKQRMGLHAPDPQMYKPSLWDRIKGGAIGALAGGLSGDEKKGEDLGKRFTYSKYNRAAGQYGRQSGELDKNMDMEKGALPFAEAASKVPQEDFKNKMELSKEGRERATAQSNANYKSDIAAIREEVANGNRDKAENMLDQKQKELEQKKVHDQEWFEMQQQILDLRKQNADKGRDHTSQVTGAETTKANAISKAHAVYSKATADLPTDPKAQWSDEQRGQLKAAKDAYDEATQDAQDSYESKASELGGRPVEHQDVAQWRGGNGAGKPAAAASSSDEALPTEAGPANEKPAKTGTGKDGKKYGYFNSTKQWMLIPTERK